MENVRDALWHKLEDIDRDLEGLEAVARLLTGSDSLGDPDDVKAALWHLARGIQDIRAQVDEATAATMQIRTVA